MREVRFYFDVVCPYAYLASTEIEELCARAGARLVWRPVLLGGLFRSLGSPDRPADGAPAAKLHHTWLDLARWARFRRVPLTLPPDHPRRSVQAMRLCVAAGERAPELAKVLFRANFVDGDDIADPGVLDRIAVAQGIDPAAMDREDVKQSLREVTAEATRAGAFGVPTFLVTTDADDGTPPQHDLFFGQDRMHFVARALAGWRPPA